MCVLLRSSMFPILSHNFEGSNIYCVTTLKFTDTNPSSHIMMNL